jgi:hypothetical protein
MRRNGVGWKIYMDDHVLEVVPLNLKRYYGILTYSATDEEEEFQTPDF